MDKAVVIAIFTWLLCWMFDLMAILAPPMSLLFVIIKLVFVIIAVATIGHMGYIGKVWF